MTTIAETHCDDVDCEAVYGGNECEAGWFTVATVDDAGNAEEFDFCEDSANRFTLAELVTRARAMRAHVED